MAEKPLPWFRAYPEAAFDPKFDIVARQSGMDSLAVFGAWWKILCLAGSSPVRGSLYVTVMKRFSIDDVTAMLRCSNDQCNALMTAFIDMEMIVIDENGAYHVKNWEKRQFESDSSTERVKKHREREKKAKEGQSETLQKRSSNGAVTPPDPDTDTELIKEILSVWAELFPKKPQPKTTTYKSKILTRCKDKHFRDNWRRALTIASQSQSCQAGGWFDFAFFIKDEKNYQKMLNDWMNWKDVKEFGKMPTVPEPHYAETY